MNHDADVIVAGAGPAGSEFAYRLAREGYSVIVLERDELDREKPCGGGIQTQEILEFGALPQEIVERHIDTARIVAPNGSTLEIPRYLGACGATVRRSVYDRWLSRRADNAGAVFIARASVVSAETCCDGASVHYEQDGVRKTVRGRLFAIAAGAAARELMQSLGLPLFKTRNYAVTSQYWMELGKDVIDERVGDAIELYNGSSVIPKGYAWIFPKRDVVTVGLGCDVSVLEEYGVSLKKRLDEFIARHPIAAGKLAGGRIVRRDGGPIPFFVAPRLTAPSMLLLGDAGGFGNAIHGGGIYQARKSAAIAAPHAIRFLEGQDSAALENYAHEAREHFNDYEGRWDVKMRPFFWEDDLVNALAVRTAESDPDIAHAIGIILNGDQSHEAAYRLLEPRMLDLVHDCLVTRCARQRRVVEAALDPLFRNGTLVDSIARQAIFGDAKRVRASLALIAVEAAGSDWMSATPMAVAFELLHTASLLHDDIMDGSETRRGRQCVYKTHGVDLAITVGDALIFEAYRQLGLLGAYWGAERAAEAFQIFSHCALRTCHGQANDLRFPFEDGSIRRYLKMVHRKTGSMIAAPLEGAAALVGAPDGTRRAFRSLGNALGAAFQIVDDAIDYLGSEERAKKSISNDLKRKAASPMLIYTRQHCSAGEREEMAQSIARYRASGATADLRPVYELFRKYDAISFTQNLSLRYVNRCRNALLAVEDGPGKRDLAGLVDIVGYWGLLAARLPDELAADQRPRSLVDELTAV